MTNVGEEITTEDRLVGEHPIRSRGLEVFVCEETIRIWEGKWKNEAGEFDTLEEAIKDVWKRNTTTT